MGVQASHVWEVKYLKVLNQEHRFFKKGFVRFINILDVKGRWATCP